MAKPTRTREIQKKGFTIENGKLLRLRRFRKKIGHSTQKTVGSSFSQALSRKDKRGSWNSQKKRRKKSCGLEGGERRRVSKKVKYAGAEQTLN